MYVCIPRDCAVPREARKMVPGPLELGLQTFMDYQLCGWWKVNWSPPEECPVLLITEPSLQNFLFFF